MDAAGGALSARAVAAVAGAPTRQGYVRDEVLAILDEAVLQRDALQQAIEEARNRTADLSAAADSAETLHEDLGSAWLAAEREAQLARREADERAATMLHQAEQEAARIVSQALAEAADHAASDGG